MITNNSYLKDWGKDDILYNIRKINKWKKTTVFTVTKGMVEYTTIKKWGVTRLREFFDNNYSHLLIEYMEEK